MENCTSAVLLTDRPTLAKNIPIIMSHVSLSPHITSDIPETTAENSPLLVTGKTEKMPSIN